MFPVSGAEQFSASGAIAGLQPVISASGAYSRFDRPGAPSRVREEQVPEAAGSSFGLELVHHRRVGVRVAGGLDLFAVDGLRRVDAFVHEREEACAQVLDPIVPGEVHGAPSSSAGHGDRRRRR